MASTIDAGDRPDDTRVDELVDGLLADFAPGKVDDRAFLGAQFDRGLAWVHFPEGLGGSGLSPGLQQRVTGDCSRPVRRSRAR